MKYRSIALILTLLIAATLPAQQTAPPDILTPQTAASIAFMTYKSWAETQIKSLWDGLQVQQDLTSTLPQDRANIVTLQQQVADLQAQVKALTPVVPPPSTAPPAVPVAVTINANSATSGINAGEVQPTPDTVSNGSKVILAAGRSYVYTQSISAGTYAVTARLSSDTGTTGNISLHLESPQGVRVSGVIITPCSATWVNVPASQPLILTASPLVVVADAVCSGRSYMDILSLNP